MIQLLAVVIGLILLGAFCRGLADSFNAMRKIIEVVKGLFSVAAIVFGIVLWVKTGDWIAFFLPVAVVVIPIMIFDFGYVEDSTQPH